MKGYLDTNTHTLYVFPQTADEIPYVDPSATSIAVQQEDIEAWKTENESVADLMVTYNYNVITMQKKVWSDHIDDDIEAPVYDVTLNLSPTEQGHFAASPTSAEATTIITVTPDNVEFYDSNVTIETSPETALTWSNQNCNWTFAMPENDITLTIRQKSQPGLAWSAESYTATIGETNTFPTLTNTNNVTVSYTSNSSSVASINETTGEITLVDAGGPVLISAVFDGNDTYRAQTVSYDLTVQAAENENNEQAE